MGPIVIQTARLNLREWTSADADADAEANAEANAEADADELMVLAGDAEVMRYISGGVAHSREQVIDFIERQRATQRERGWCRWALQLRAPAPHEPTGVAGFCGPGCTFAPEVEVGWWVHPALWGRGLATEAALAAVDYCFATVGFDRLICCVHPENARSLAVARKVGFVPRNEFEFRGMPVLRHELHNVMPDPPRDPRFVRSCE